MSDIEYTLAQAVIEHFHGPDDRHGSWWLNPDELAEAFKPILTEFLSEYAEPLKHDAYAEGFADGRRQDAEGDDGPRFTNPYRRES